MMAFVNDEMPVFGHAVIDDPLADKALDESDVDLSGKFPVPAAEATDGLGGQAKERGE